MLKQYKKGRKCEEIYPTFLECGGERGLPIRNSNIPNKKTWANPMGAVWERTSLSNQASPICREGTEKLLLWLNKDCILVR